MKALTDFLAQFHPVPGNILGEYASCWSKYRSPRKTLLTSQGQTEGYLYVVREVMQKSYYENAGKEHIMFFAYPPSFSGVMESFFTQTPSHYFLETLPDSEFLRLPYAQHQKYIRQYREIETLFRIITEHLLRGVIERHHELLAFNAETRLKNLLQRSPHLLNLIPQKDLASYLRIDPTNFSKCCYRFISLFQEGPHVEANFS